MPNGTGQSQQTMEFVFVNQDEKTASKRQGSNLNAMARAHVMGTYVRKKNAARIQNLRNDSVIDSFMGRVPHTSGTTEDQPKPPSHLENSTKSSPLKARKGRRAVKIIPIHTDREHEHTVSKQQEGKTFGVQNRVTDDADEKRFSRKDFTKTHDESPTQQLILVPKNHQPSPKIIYLDTGTSDPFAASAVPVGSWEHYLIKFFIQKLTPGVYGAEKESSDSIMKRKAHQMAFHHIIKDAGSLFSLFAVSCANEELIRGVKPTSGERVTGPGQTSSLYYKMKTIQVVRETIARIQNPVTDIDDRLIGIMLGLLGTDWANTDYPAAFVHIRAICNLVKLRGGLHTLSGQWAEDVVVADVSMAVATVTSPILPLTWAPADLPESIVISAIPSPSCPLASLGHRILSTTSLPEELLTGSAKLRQIVWIAEPTTSITPADEPRVKQWVAIATPALEHRLLSFHQYHTQVSGLHIERCICLALLLFTRSSLHYQNYWQQVYLLPPLKRLREDIPWTDLKGLWGGLGEILLWVLCMGVYAAERCGEQGVRSWFGVQLGRVVSSLGLSSFGDVEGLLEGAFYLKRVHGEVLKMVWVTATKMDGDVSRDRIAASNA